MSLSILFLAACGRPVTETDVKMVGVGLDPDEIGPAPEYFGGLIEVDRIEFAGGDLPLGVLGFTSYDQVGPSLVGFEPPYVVVFGLAFIFDDLVPAPDVHHGNIAVAPDAVDACWTNTEPLSYLLAGTAEIGDEIVMADTEGTTSLTFGRFPEIYPPDPQDVFVYYQAVESWVSTPVTNYVVDDDGQLQENVLRASNWSDGTEVNLSFKGGIPPLEAPVSSIPLPSSYVGDPSIVLPARPQNLWLSWNGPHQDVYAEPSSGDYATCVRYWGSTFDGTGFVDGPVDDLDCAGQAEFPSGQVESNYFPGQVYTGPWDTTDGQVTFNWEPGSEDVEDTVVLNVRFLPSVDRTDDAFQVGRVPVDAHPDIQEEWDKKASRDKVTGDLPQGYRNPLACDDDDNGLEYIFNPTYERADGELLPTLQGDPSGNLVEVTCRLEDDGEFSLTNEHLAKALAYATANDAGGAIFYFSRSTESEAAVPPVRDQAGFKRDINDIKLRANSVQIGRFQVDQLADLDKGN